MNFYEQEKKEQDLRFEAWNKIEKALKTLEQLENNNNHNIKILSEHVEALKATNILENLNKVKNIAEETTKSAKKEIEITKNHISDFENDIFYLLKNNPKIFLFYVPAVIILGLIFIFFYGVRTYVISTREISDSNSQSIKNIEQILIGKKSYWFDQKNHEIYIRNSKNQKND